MSAGHWPGPWVPRRGGGGRAPSSPRNALGHGEGEPIQGRTACRLVVLATAGLAVFTAPFASAQERSITLGSTTSTDNSGLFAHLLPIFTARTRIKVRVIATGTGAALRLGERGDVDVVLVHAREAEDRFIAAGHGIGRRDVMYNDFVIVGPRSDPAGVLGAGDAVAALRRIAAARARFVSRGDASGTHVAELRLWRRAGVDPAPGSGAWYFEVGAGMGATLNITAAKNAYTLTDRGTWLAFRNRGTLTIVLEGDPRLFNPYGVILVNPARHPDVKREDGTAFIDWLTSAEGQAAIAAFRIEGKQAFFPMAGPRNLGRPGAGRAEPAAAFAAASFRGVPGRWRDGTPPRG